MRRVLPAVLLCTPVLCPAEEPAPLSPWQAYFRRMASHYDMRLQSDPPRALRALDQPIMKWSQPVRGGDDGAVFLWLDGTRPAAIGSMFIWPAQDGSQGVTHELHSLADGALIATWNNRRWTPPGPGVVWRDVPEAPVPAGTERGRQQQLKALARRFTAHSRNRGGDAWTLRLLPRPLYEYGADEKEVLTGAVYGLVEGTDLEIVLLVEARRDDGRGGWRYAAARMSDLKLTLLLDDAPVWNVDFGNYDVFNEAYSCSAVEFRREPPAP
jgi:hypothetical protein